MSSTKKLHLQGLRGIAIFGVLLVHFYPDWFPNGYLGVDIFFVLSGFLMCLMMSKTSISLESVADFLFRRIRRIIPLYFLVILVTSLALPVFFRREYLPSSTTDGLKAILLVTNQAQILHSSTYEIEMRMGINVFLHTWSLCLELQYYLMYPFLYIITSRQPYSSTIIIFISFLYYLICSPIVAFNGVTTRVWQFISGASAFQNSPLTMGEYNIINNNKEDFEDQCLIEKQEEDVLPTTLQEEKDSHSMESNLVNISIIVMLFCYLSPVKYNETYSRLVTTAFSWIIIKFGASNSTLCCSPLVFLGEISYALYLVHWPIVSYLRITDDSDEIKNLIGIISALILATVLHYGFERYNMKWNKTICGVVVVVLFLSCLASLLYLRSSPNIQMEETNHKNLTSRQKQLIELSEENQAKDLARLAVPSCHYENTWESLCTVENTTFSGKSRLLVVGNSWASNVGQIIVDQCSQHTANINIQSTGSCEVLVQSTNTGYNCVEDEKKFFDIIEKFKPDVLFIIEKHMTLATTPDSKADKMMKQVNERVQRVMQFVKGKIYILGSFPVISSSLMPDSIKLLAQNGTLDSTKYLDLSKMLSVEHRLNEILKFCDKCEIFDYKPHFLRNGQYQLFDPETQMSYFSFGQHLTPVGKPLVFDVYKKLCAKLV